MTSQPVQCPQCDAPLTLMPGQRFVQCAYCGGKFAIDLAPDQAPRLTPFEPTPSAPAAAAAAHDAPPRHAELELTLADAEDDVDYQQAELAAAKSAYWRARVDLQRLVAPLQNTTYLAGLLAMLAAFATLFAFSTAQRLPGAVIALLLAATGWAFHREWQEEEVAGQSACREAREAVREAQAGLNNAWARMDNLGLEPELLQQQILATQARPAATGPTTANAT